MGCRPAGRARAGPRSAELPAAMLIRRLIRIYLQIAIAPPRPELLVAGGIPGPEGRGRGRRPT